MLSFDVFYYKSKTKLTSAQHPARVHSSATPTLPFREGSRVPPPGQPARCLSYFRPSTTPSLPLSTPALPAGKPAGTHPPAEREERDLARMLSARKIPERLSRRVLPAARCEVRLPRGCRPYPARGRARRAPATAPGQRRCRRCPVAFVQQWRGGAGRGY